MLDPKCPGSECLDTYLADDINSEGKSSESVVSYAEGCDACADSYSALPIRKTFHLELGLGLGSEFEFARFYV